MESTIFTYSTELMHAMSWTLLHSIWQGLIVAILLLIVVRFGKKLNASTKYISAIASLVILLCCSIITFYLYLEIPTFGDTISIHQMANWGETALLATPQETSWTSSLSQFVSINSRLISLSWLIGLSFFILRILFGIFQIQRLKKERSNLSSFWIDKLEVLKQKVGYTKTILLGESTNISSPLTFGFIKPVLLFPIGMVNQLSVEQVEAIMAHELAHIIRKDYLINLIQTFIESIYYFNPAVWIISTIIRNQREHCCDDIAIELTGNNIHYIKALVAVEENKNNQNSILAMALTKNKKPLLNRVKRILNQPQNNENMKEKLLMCSLLFMGVLFLSIKANSTKDTIPTVSLQQESSNANTSERDSLLFATSSNYPTVNTESAESNVKHSSEWVGDFSNAYNRAAFQWQEKSNEKLTISISESNVFFFEGVKITKDEMKSLLKDMKGEKIILVIHPKAKVENVVFIMDLAMRYKIETVLEAMELEDIGQNIIKLDNVVIRRNDNRLYPIDTKELSFADLGITKEMAAIMRIEAEKDKALFREVEDMLSSNQNKKQSASISDTLKTNENKIDETLLSRKRFENKVNEMNGKLEETMKEVRQAISKREKQDNPQIKSLEKDINLNVRDTLPHEYSKLVDSIKDSLALRFLIGKSTFGLDLEDKLKLKNDLLREYTQEMQELARELKSKIQIEIEKAKEYQDFYQSEVKIELEEKLEDLHFELQGLLGDYNLDSRDNRKGDKTEGGFDELTMFSISRIDIIAHNLLEDGLIDDISNFSFKFKNKKLHVNKKQQPNSVYERYANIIRAWAKAELSPNTKVQIVRKKGEDSFTIHLLD